VASSCSTPAWIHRFNLASGVVIGAFAVVAIAPAVIAGAVRVELVLDPSRVFGAGNVEGAKTRRDEDDRDEHDARGVALRYVETSLECARAR
jgi:hypothetical protein